LRYLSGDATVATQLNSLPQPKISFNYLGQFGYAQPESSPIITSSASYGSVASLDECRRTLLDINGGVSDGEIQFAWTYSENVHRQFTIESLANDFVDALKTLIEHCRSAETGGYTPSDFSKARLSQNELDQFLGALHQEVEGKP
jgi:non-ribosomal peptide synthase protein (TIGR01720 family)